MEKEKLKILIKMIECELEELADIPKAFSQTMSISYLLNKLKEGICDETQIDMDEVCAMVGFIGNVKSEKNLITEIQNMDAKTLDKIADFQANQIILESKKNHEKIDEEDFKQLKEYSLWLLENGLVGKPIQTVEYNGYSAEQFQNFKVLFTKDSGEISFCNYYKKATKQELKKLIDDIKAGKISSKV